MPTSTATASPETMIPTPLSVSIIVPTVDDGQIDLHKYSVTDLQRLNCNIADARASPLAFQILHPMMHDDQPVFPVRQSKMDSFGRQTMIVAHAT